MSEEKIVKSNEGAKAEVAPGKQSSDLQQLLAAAQAAEAKNDLETAVASYARLVAALENKGEQQTIELQTANENLAERNNELAIINSVQEAVAAALDLQTIFEIVGEKLSELYDGHSVSLDTYEEDAQSLHQRIGPANRYSPVQAWANRALRQ